MKSYLNIRIDGTEYGENVEPGPRAADTVNASGAPGVPGAPRGPYGPISRPEDQERLAAIVKLRRRTAAERYENAVFRVLVDLSHWESGRALIAEIRRLGKHVKIIPYLPLTKDWTNGSARPLDPEDATRNLWRVRNNDGDPVKGLGRGTGAGSDCEIEYITKDLASTIHGNAHLQVKSEWTEGHEEGSLDFEDEILFHELVHAVRQMAGFSNRRRVPRQPKYDNMEELFAIVATNIYRSERNRGGVRNNNHGKMDLMFCSGKQFLNLEFNRLHLAQFRRQHPQFVQDLARVHAYFNPFEHMPGAAR